MAIEVTQLTKRYQQQVAIDQLTFTTQRHKIIAFLGPNGAGKSTTLKILAGILPPTQGSASILDIDMHKNPLACKKILGYLPEHNPLYTEMYVREILHFQAQTHHIKEAQQRIDEVIALTGLAAEQHKKIHQLSKGYKQRVGLAMAIMHNPEVLLLDEPTTGLDPNQIREIRSLIKSLSRDKTVFLSTHLMQEVEAICDEVIIIHQGQLQAQFSMSELPTLFPNMTLEQVFIQLTGNP